MTAYLDTDALKAEYAPYHTMFAFHQGLEDYGTFRRSVQVTGVDQQAYDRGLEAAMRIKRATRWIEQNVGAN